MCGRTKNCGVIISQHDAILSIRWQCIWRSRPRLLMLGVLKIGTSGLGRVCSSHSLLVLIRVPLRLASNSGCPSRRHFQSCRKDDQYVRSESTAALLPAGVARRSRDRRCEHGSVDRGVNDEFGLGEQTLGTWGKAETDRLRGEDESTGSLGEGERGELARFRRRISGSNRTIGS